MKRIFQFAVLFLVLVPATLMAQSTENEKVYLWDLSANVGSSLLWGDAASSGSPFTRWFGKESNLTFGLALNRKLSNTFGIQAVFQKGMLSGERVSWTGDAAHPIINSRTDFFDYNIGLNVDFTSLFGFKPDRFMSVYGFGGVGMMHYDAQSNADGFPYNAVKDNTLIIPWGGGLKFRLNNRWNALLETNFRNTFSDDIDAYIGSGTDVNDIYSITSIGVTYKFGEKKEKKPKIEISPVEPADSLLAEIYTPVTIGYTSTIPTQVEPNFEYPVKTLISKGDLKGNAIYELKIPEDFYVKDIVSNGGKISQEDNSFRITWEEMPADKLEISYLLSTGGLDKESYVIASNLNYNEKEESKVKTFTSRVNLKPMAISVVEKPAEVVVEQETPQVVVVAPVVEQETVKSNGLEYRIQVAAVFGGTTSKRMLQKQLGLSEEVKEDPYKNSYRYTVGSYTSYAEAAQHAALSTVNGAYVVAFKDGKYVGGLENTNTDIMDKNGIYPNGSTYKVQIAASKDRTYSIAKLAYKYGLKENEITEDEIAGWYQYSVGKFTSNADAKQLLDELKLKVPKAYIIHFEDGVRN